MDSVKENLLNVIEIRCLGVFSQYYESIRVFIRILGIYSLHFIKAGKKSDLSDLIVKRWEN